MASWSDRELADLVTEVSRTLRRETRQAFDDDGEGLAPHQARALRYVCRNEPARPGQVAASLRIAPRSATDVLDALVQRGLLTREPDPSDRRALLLRPTPQGRETAHRFDAVRLEVASRMFRALNDADRVALARILTHLLEG